MQMTVKEVAELIKYTKFFDQDSHCYRVMNITSEETKKVVKSQFMTSIVLKNGQKKKLCM